MVIAGRYETYDMHPVGQDVFLERTGDTSDEQYNDGQGYYYQMKEGRGRDAGQVMFAYQADALYLEISSLIGNRIGFFDGAEYHGESVERNKDSFIIRPVLVYQFGDFKASEGMETNLISDAILDDSGRDVSDRTGYGVPFNYNVSGLDLNLNYSYMDALDETDYTFGFAGLYNRIGLGYFWAENKFSNGGGFNDSNGKRLAQPFT